MTTPDPSREAFDKWAQTHYRNFEEYGIRDYLMGLTAWQTAEAAMQVDLEQAHEARRQAQAELADMQEKRNRIGLDIDRALRGEVNEQSPIAGRLKLIAEAAAPKQEGST